MVAVYLGGKFHGLLSVMSFGILIGTGRMKPGRKIESELTSIVLDVCDG
jgi:hypothetical protein